MKWIPRRARKPAAPRSNDEILAAYENNRDISRDECRVLYELIDDPWDLGSRVNYDSYVQFLKACDKYVDWPSIDWIVDYGSGIGTFSRALKDLYPHIRSMGVDFDTARVAAEKRFGADIFDAYYAMDRHTNEYDLLNAKLPALDAERLCICFFNSVNYVFKDQKKKKRPAHLDRLIRKFETLAQASEHRYLIASSNFFDEGAAAAMDRSDCELVYLSRDLGLESRIADFQAELHTRIWQHR